MSELEIAKLYRGNFVIEYNDDEHVYRHNGIALDGVTTILNVMAKDALVPWAAKCTAEQFEINIKKWLDYQQNKVGGVTWRNFLADMPEMSKDAKKAWMRVRDDAADIGTVAHDYAQAKLIGQKDLTLGMEGAQVEKAIDAVDGFFDENKLEPLHVERIMASQYHWYAGRCDWIGHLNEGPLSVNDYKSSKRFYKGVPYISMGMQLAAYAIAYEEEFGVEIEEGNIIRLDKKTGKPHIHNIKLTQGLKTAFLCARALHKQLKWVRKEHDDIG